MEGQSDSFAEDLRQRNYAGEILCKTLEDGITFEGTKKRKRMIQEADLRPLSPLRIYQDVDRVVERIKNYRPPPPVTERLKILQSLLKAQACGNLELSAIEPWVCWELDLADESDISQILGDSDMLEERLRMAINRVHGSKEYEVGKKGGQRTDPRLDKLVADLAFLYKAYTGYRATYSGANDGSGQQSPFFWFAARVLQIFFKDGHEAEWATRNGSLETAIRRISKFEREDEPMSDMEVKAHLAAK